MTTSIFGGGGGVAPPTQEICTKYGLDGFLQVLSCCHGRHRWHYDE